MSESSQGTLLAALEGRMRALEDHAAITRLLMTHPLAIDGGAGDFWLSHWSDDSVVDRLPDPEKHSGDYAGVYGKDLMREEIRSPELSALRESGLCHFVTMPRIQIAGDTANATNYLQLVGVEEKGYRLRRIVVSRWELRRVSGQWEITKRVMRPLGHADAVALMQSALPAGSI